MALVIACCSVFLVGHVEGRVSADSPTPLNLTYGELCLATTIPNWDAFLKIVPQLIPSLQPDSLTVKAIRTAVGNVRNLVDIFIYAYPIVRVGMVADVVLVLVNDVQTGWSQIGAYHDLSNVNYTEAERQSAMATLQKWLAHFKQNFADLKYDAFVRSASKDQFYDRPHSEISYLYWGWSTMTPRKNDTGLENIAVLLDGMWQVEQQNFHVIINLPDMWNNVSQENFFHNFRKIIRSAIYAINLFPQAYAVNYTKHLDIADEGHDIIGEMKDYLQNYYFYKQHGNEKAAEEERKEGTEFWNENKEWFDEVDFPGVLVWLQRNLIRH